nr:mitofilin family membrane protein [Cognatishimia sp. F0-27]
MAAENSAANQAVLAANRVALAEVTSRVQAGQPYAEPLTTLQNGGVALPDVLTANAAEGVPTQALLVSEFPDLARDALREARAAAPEETSGLGGFLQAQLGARSVTPREGNDPDAVLSRAEAALAGGDLDTALSEIGMLPEPAQAVLSDWVAKAETRHAAMNATAQLTQELNQQ